MTGAQAGFAAAAATAAAENTDAADADGDAAFDAAKDRQPEIASPDADALAESNG